MILGTWERYAYLKDEETAQRIIYRLKKRKEERKSFSVWNVGEMVSRVEHQDSNQTHWRAPRALWSMLYPEDLLLSRPLITDTVLMELVCKEMETFNAVSHIDGDCFNGVSQRDGSMRGRPGPSAQSCWMNAWTSRESTWVWRGSTRTRFRSTGFSFAEYILI